jgi:hypothetical protein
MMRFLLLLLAPSLALAQPERYELGQRLKDFELAWEKHEDPARRKAALKDLPGVTQQFFSLQLGEAGRTLDVARWRLTGTEPSEAQKWIASLYAMPEKMLYTSKDKRITVTVKHFYKMKSQMPAGAKVRLGFPGEEKIEKEIGKLPMEVTVPLPRRNGLFADPVDDYFLQIIFTAEGGASHHREVMVSMAIDPGNLATENAPLETATLHTDPKAHALLAATRKDFNERVKSLLDGEIPETNIHGSRLVDVVRSINRTTADTSRATAIDPYLLRGTQALLAIPTGKGRSIAVRLSVPKDDRSLIRDAKRPVVVALHGAGGSENLFFEGYGAGHIVKECEKRGWYLVAPRSGISFTGTPPVKEILESLEALLPIDRDEVFVGGGPGDRTGPGEPRMVSRRGRARRRGPCERCESVRQAAGLHRRRRQGLRPARCQGVEEIARECDVQGVSRPRAFNHCSRSAAGCVQALGRDPGEAQKPRH